MELLPTAARTMATFSKFSDDFFIPATVTIVAVLFSIFALLRKKKAQQQQNKLPWPRIPGDGCTFFKGHFAHVKERKYMCKFLEQWADEYGQEMGGYQMKLGRINYLVLNTEEYAQEIFKQRPAKIIRYPGQRAAAHSIGALGIFSAEGDDWKQDTKLVRPAFNRANVQEYLCIFNDMAGRLVEKWGKEITAKGGGSSHDNDGIISINRDLTNLTADNIGKTSTDTDFDFLHNPDKGMAADVIDTQQAGVYRTFRPFPYWKIPIIGQYLDLYGFCLRRLHKEFRAVVNEYEAQLMKEDDEQGDGGSSSGSNSIGRRKTFMAKLFEVMKTQKTQMSPERVIGNILTLFIAGSDTTSKTLVDALYLIAQDPLLQQELAAEAVAFFANTKEERFTLDEMHEQSPRIKSFLHEVHRLYGVPFMLMQASEEVSVGGQTIQPGQSMILLWRYIAKRNPRCPMGPAGEMADEFCGRRFLVCQETNETGKTILTCPPPDPSVVMGFGGGMRSCPGRTYAESVQQVVLLRLLQNFSFKVAPNHPPTEDIFEVVILPDKPIQLQVTKR